MFEKERVMLRACNICISKWFSFSLTLQSKSQPWK